MYKSYNQLQLNIYKALEKIVYIIQNYEYILYIRGNYQYQSLLVDDYSIRLILSPLLKSVFNISNYLYLPYIYEVLSKPFIFLDDSFHAKFEELIKEVANRKDIVELNTCFLKEVYIDKYKDEEILHNFLMDNIQVFLDVCYKPYIFNINKGGLKDTSFYLKIKSYIDLNGNPLQGFKSLLFYDKYPYISNPYILIFDGFIDDVYNLIPILEKVKEQEKDIILITKGIDDKVTQCLIENHNKSIVNIRVFIFDSHREPYEFIYDLSKVLGSRLIGYETDLKRLKLGDLGYCASVILYDDKIRFDFNEQSNIPFLVHKRKLQRGCPERLKRLEFNSYIDINVGAFTDIERDRRYNYIYSFLNRLEDIRGGGDILYLPNGLGSLDKASSLFNKKYQPIYIERHKLEVLLKELYSVLNIYRTLMLKV